MKTDYIKRKLIVSLTVIIAVPKCLNTAEVILYHIMAKLEPSLNRLTQRMGALGTWALRWEAAEAKSMRECISFTCSLANLTIPFAQVTEDQYVRVLIIFLRFLYKINNLDLQIIKLSLAQLTEVGASVSPPIKQSRCRLLEERKHT